MIKNFAYRASVSLLSVTATLALLSAGTPVFAQDADTDPSSRSEDSVIRLPQGDGSDFVAQDLDAPCNVGRNDFDSLECGAGAGTQGVQATAIGNRSDARGDRSASLGFNAEAFDVNAVAIGAFTDASGPGAIAIGAFTEAKAIDAIAIGDRAFSEFGGAIAIGANAEGLADNAVALGRDAIASGSDSLALGVGAEAVFFNSIAIGAGATTDRVEQIKFGNRLSTYTFSGIASGASRLAQGEIDGIIITDADGNLASDGGRLAARVTFLENTVGSGGGVTQEQFDALADVVDENAGFIANQSTDISNLLARGQLNADAIEEIGADVAGNTADITALDGHVNALESEIAGIADLDGTGEGSTAVGTNAIASARNSTAVGDNAEASGENATAIGFGATATGSVAVGFNSFASNGGTAVGDNAESAGEGSAAFGEGASANQTGSTAIGANATAVRANQLVLGTDETTYTAAGITSVQSREVQDEVVGVITTDAQGNLASDEGALQAAIISNTGGIAQNGTAITANTTGIEANTQAIGNLSQQFAGFDLRLENFGIALNQQDRRIGRIANGLAAATAIPDAYLDSTESYAISGGFSVVGDEVGFGGSVMLRASDRWSFGASLGVSGGQAAGRLQFRLAN